MSMTAKYGGKCLTCGRWIEAGSKVMYEPGRGIRHPRGACKAAEAAPAAAPAERKSEALDPTRAEIIGRAEYKGHDYLLLWEGTTKRGTRAAKLAFRDGTKVFWADEYRVSKRYREPISLRQLDRYAAEHKEQQAAEQAAAAEQRKQAEMTPEQRLAAIDEILARAGRTRATRDDGAGLVTEPLSFTRDGKEGPRVGEIIRHTRKGHTQPSAYVVVSISAPYYHSEDDCEDQDCFCGHYGWQVSYDAIRVAPTEAESAANAEAERKRVRKEEVARLLHASYGGENHIDSAPEGVTMTKLYGASRLAGSETWYLGSDGVVYYCRSDYDMGPSWWRTSATPELVREAEQLGVRP